jgi:hypothetical protein
VAPLSDHVVQSVLVEGLSSSWLAGGAHTSHRPLLRLPSASRAGVGANSAWITHRSMKMIVKAHQGSNGMNVKSMNTEIVAIRIPSQRGHAAPEKTPKPAARLMMPPTRPVHGGIRAVSCSRQGRRGPSGRNRASGSG